MAGSKAVEGANLPQSPTTVSDVSDFRMSGFRYARGALGR
jgi:hypothetical protein